MEELGYKAGLSKCLMKIGIVFKNQGDYEKALEYHNNSMIIYKELGDNAGIALCLANMGITYEQIGRQNDANAHYEKAAILCEEMGLHEKAHEYRSRIK